MRRLLKIATAVLLLSSLILGLLLIVFLDRAFVDEWAKKEVIAALERRFPVHVDLVALRLKLWEGILELEGLEVSNSRDPTSEPAIEIDLVRLGFSISRYFSPTVLVDRISLESPCLRVVQDRNGRLNLSNMLVSTSLEPVSERPLLVRIEVEELSIENGLLVYQTQPFRLDSAEGSLSANARFLPNGETVGNFVLESLDLAVGGFNFSQVAVSSNFEIVGETVQISDFELNAPELSARITGRVEGWTELNAQFDVNASLELPQLRKPDLSPYFQQGRIDFSGNLTGRPENLVFRGELSSPQLRFQEIPFRDLHGEVTLASEGLSLEKVRVGCLGGLIEAKGMLSWEETRRSQLALAGTAIGIQPFLAVLGWESVEVRGLADVQSQLTWPGFNWQQLEGQGNLIYRGSFQIASEETRAQAEALPFEGGCDLTSEKEVLQLSGGMLRTHQSSLAYSGQISLGGLYDLDLDLVSSEGQELQGVAQANGLLPQQTVELYPFALRGRSLFRGKLGGSGHDFSVQGRTEVEEVDFRGHRLGAFSGQVGMGQDLVRLEEAEFRDPSYRLGFSLTFPVEGEDLEGLRARARLDKVPVERFLPMAGLSLPLEGRISGEAQVEYLATGSYTATANLWGGAVEAYGELVDRYSGELEFRDGTLRGQGLNASLSGGRISGSFGVDLESREYSVSVQLERMQLERLHLLQQQTPVQGELSLSLEGQGRFDHPGFRLDARSSLVKIGDFTLEDVHLEADGEGKEASIRLVHRFAENPFLFEGTVGLLAPHPLDVSLHLEKIPIGPYLALLGYDPGQFEGLVSGKARCTGPLLEPTKIQAEGSFPEIELSLSGHRLENSSALRLVYQEETLRIDPLSLSGSGTQLNLSGSVGLGESPNIDLRLDGQANLLILNSFLDSGATSGQLRLDSLSISGPWQDPRIVGEASLSDGFLSHPEVPSTVFDAEGKVKFTSKQISIDEFSASTPYGRVSAEGGIFVEGFTPTRWQVNVFGSNLQVQYPQDVVSTIDLDLDLLKAKGSQLVTGVVYVREAEYSKDLSLPKLFLAYAESQIPPTPSLGGEILLEIEVEAYQSLRVRNRIADVTGSGDFTIRGTAQRPVILGTITLDEGTLSLENNRYEVTRGTVNFSNPRSTTPVVNFEATTDVREFTVTVVVRGSLDKLNLSFRSDPPLPASSIVSLLAIGQTQEEIFGTRGTGQDQLGTLAVYGAGALLSKSLGEQLEAQTSRLFGFEKFSIDPFLFGRERDPGARITLGKQLTRELAMTYSTNLSNDQQGQVIVIEYRLTDWMTAAGTREQDGSIAVDVKLKKRF